MAEKKFRRKKAPGATLYSYPPKRSLRSEELSAYRRLALTFIVILVFAGFLYLWGIQIVATLASLWENFIPTSSSEEMEEKVSFVAIPKLDPLPSAINDLANFNVSGWANTGMDVQILVNDQEIADLLTDASGRFTATNLRLKEGDNKITAYSVSSTGQQSELAKIQVVTFDKTSPPLEIIEPEEGAEFSGKEEIWRVIVGETEPKAKITINDHQAIVDMEGNFRFQYRLNEGENPLKIVAQDEAGNETTIERIVKYLPAEDSSEESATPTPTENPEELPPSPS